MNALQDRELLVEMARKHQGGVGELVLGGLNGAITELQHQGCRGERDREDDAYTGENQPLDRTDAAEQAAHRSESAAFGFFLQSHDAPRPRF
jgi:hypothetical protein